MNHTWTIRELSYGYCNFSRSNTYVPSTGDCQSNLNVLASYAKLYLVYYNRATFSCIA